MEKFDYANMANKLLGKETYSKLIQEISKENNGENLIDFGKEVVDQCCFLIIMMGMSKEIKLDNIKLCVGKDIIEISCKEFAMRYQKYINEVEKKVLETVKEIQ